MFESRWWGVVVVGVVASACASDRQFVWTLSTSMPASDPTAAEPPPVEVIAQTDILVQLAPPRVDVLWVVDNSGSMGDEQAALTDNFPRFMAYFLASGLDYHLGVVSTDMSEADQQGRLQSGGTPYRFIDPTTVDAFGVFTAMATLGTSGSVDERGLDATYAALETLADTDNAGFQRDDAALHTIVLSDESDYLAPESIPDADVVTWYDVMKADPAHRTFSSIVDPESGAAYVGVTDAIGGILWDIHDPAYDQALDALGIQAAGLQREFFLSEVPLAGTIEVSVEEPSGATFVFDEVIGVPQVGDWTYDATRNSVSFVVYVPPPLARIILTYDVSPPRDFTEI